MRGHTTLRSRSGSSARAVSIGIVLVLAVALGGCTGDLSDRSPEQTPSETSDVGIAESATEVETTALDVPDGTVVGTAAFESDRHDVSGTLEVVSTPNTRVGVMTFGWTILIHDFRAPEQFTGPGDFRLVAEPNSGEWPCVGSWGGAALTDWEFDDGEYRLVIADDWPAASDPSWLDSLVMLDSGQPELDADGCRFPVALSADIEWTMPDVRPDLVVIDGAVAPNAAGEVTIDDGAPVSYIVAPNDTLNAVARRFGITAEELMFLNPARQNATATPRDELVAGERLNLAKTRR
jgi:LysM repeat protein